MESLQAQNKILETQIKQLQEENLRLKECLGNTNKNYQDLVKKYNKAKLSPTHIILDTIQYQDGQKPVLTINDYQIKFESPSAKETQLVKIIFQSKHFAKITKSPISVETIYDWYKNTEGWFDITLEERNAFQKSLYNSFRRLNDKLAPFFHNKRVFTMSDKNWCLNIELKVIPTTPDKL